MKNFYSKNKSFNKDILEKFISKEDFILIQEKMSRLTLKKGQGLYQQNTNPLGIYWITEGSIKTYKSLNNKQQILRIHKKDEIIGYESILSDRKHPCSAEALEQVEVYIIPKDTILAVIDRSHPLAEQLLIILANDILEIEDHFMDIIYKTVKSKIAEVILYSNSNILATNAQNGIMYKNLHNRENIAGVVGTTRETVIRILSEFKKDNLIEIEGKDIKILNRKQLKSISLKP